MTTTQTVNLNSGRNSVTSRFTRLGEEGVNINISAWCHPTNKDLPYTLNQVKSKIRSYCFSLNTELLNDSSIMIISSVKFDRKNTEVDAQVEFDLMILNKLNLENDFDLLEKIATDFYFFLEDESGFEIE